ncbi:MAG: N-acetyl-gamma-glutamyl-phosphate reductase [Deltaproteobacteria bacterium]|nr:N-acetyl-gamma-glutamyl-phosphate reductase [Deltaproteobacteria bacterium]
MICIGIIGAAGLSGLELLHWLGRHPEVEVTLVTSTKYQGRQVCDAFPHLPNGKLVFQPNDTDVSGCEAVFLAVPNRASLEWTPKLLDQGVRVIDLSGVYRLRDTASFEKHYRLSHTSPELLQEAVFGLPECFRERIPKARVVANPGCYPTGALLGLLPFGELLGGLASSPIIDAKSGVSGAGGRVEDDATNYMEVNENFKAYKVFSHQHQPEVQQCLADLTSYPADELGEVIFTPHLLPVNRGILSTIYLRFQNPLDAEQVQVGFQEFAAQNAFVHLLPEGQLPDLKASIHSNRCVIGLSCDASRRNWIVVTSIDNLVKGASGQAIQNLNLMFGLPETAGLV